MLWTIIRITKKLIDHEKCCLLRKSMSSFLKGMLLLFVLLLWRFARNFKYHDVTVHFGRAFGAILSNAVHEYAVMLHNPSDPQNIKDWQHMLDFIHKKNYRVDKKLSYEDALVVYPVNDHGAPTKSRPVIIAYRNTDAENASGNRWRDIMSDASVAMGFFDSTPRVRAAIYIYWLVRKSYIGFGIALTGHSLGGSVADEVARAVATDPAFVRLQTFDKGMGLQGMRKGLWDHVSCRLDARDPYCVRAIHERAENDVVSGILGGAWAHNVITRPVGQKNGLGHKQMEHALDIGSLLSTRDRERIASTQSAW